MDTEFQFVPWGMFFAGLMYVVGNGVWVNHLVRERRWLGWLLWSLAAAGVLFLAALFEARLDTASTASVLQRLSSVDSENHWIAITLFALLSVPGAAAVILRQSMQWTRLALLAPALLVFLPVGSQIGNPKDGYLALSIGLTLAVCAILVIWQLLLDREPCQKEKVAV